MFQAILYLIELVFVGSALIASIIFFILCVIKRKQKIKFRVFLTLGIISLLFSIFVWNLDPYTIESNDIGENSAAFKNNFGYAPPNTIKELNVKHYVIYDTEAQFMSFTYDSTVFKKMVIDDTLLKTAIPHSNKFNYILETNAKNANTPDWFILPNYDLEKIYFKENYLNHSFSEYYMWVNKKTNMVYLYMSNFD